MPKRDNHPLRETEAGWETYLMIGGILLSICLALIVLLSLLNRGG